MAKINFIIWFMVKVSRILATKIIITKHLIIIIIQFLDINDVNKNMTFLNFIFLFYFLKDYINFFYFNFYFEIKERHFLKIENMEKVKTIFHKFGSRNSFSIIINLAYFLDFVCFYYQIKNKYYFLFI